MAQENVNVVARIRPLSNETSDETCIEIDPVSSVITLTTNQKQYHMDKVFEQNAPQEEIFGYVQPIIAAVKNGIHGTIFAYGQTGSGKTHTMIGSDENLGIIPRAIEMIFTALNEESKNRNDNFKFKISCTVLQVYNEETYDLLNKNEKIKIPASDILKNAKEVEVNSSNECMKIIKRGLEQRKVSGTSMNETSSRSHAILTLTLKTEYFKENKKHERVSRLNMVDLAGSEKRKHTNNSKTQNLESANINTSLLFLGKVIREIINQIPNQVISYRSSKLTMILRDSLGGNSKTTVIVNIHSNSKYVTETISTLDFAVNVKKVKNTAILQEFITSKETLTLKAEVKRLGDENDKLKTELAKEIEKVVQLQRIVDEKDNKINTLEKESFELEEDKSKLESELEKANQKKKKCEAEIAKMKQMINGLQNENKQIMEKVQALEIINDQIKNQRNADDNYEQLDIDSDNGDFDYGDENEVPVIPTDFSSDEESDSKENEMPVPMHASPGSTSNQSNIIRAPYYRIGTEYIHGKWVKHLYIFDSDDTGYCYNYTFVPKENTFYAYLKSNMNYFVCYKCRNINKDARTVSAIIDLNENGEEYVKLGENEHICEPQKYEPHIIIYETDYKLYTKQRRRKKVQCLLVFNSNDKTLYYDYTMISGGNSYRCNSCLKHNIFARAKLATDENGKKCCVLYAQAHQCQPRKLKPAK